MIKRVTSILLAVFLIFALSIPVFAESSVTIPVSGAWHFNDTLDFSSLSSNLTETVNFQMVFHTQVCWLLPAH